GRRGARVNYWPRHARSRRAAPRSRSKELRSWWLRSSVKGSPAGRGRRMALRTRPSGWDLGPEERVSPVSRSAAQIRVVARQPVLPGRIEDVYVERILQRLCGVRQVRRSEEYTSEL